MTAHDRAWAEIHLGRGCFDAYEDGKMAAELGCTVEGADGYHHELANSIVKRCARSGGQAAPRVAAFNARASLARCCRLRCLLALPRWRQSPQLLTYSATTSALSLRCRR
jgi:hypothetical protein